LSSRNGSRLALSFRQGKAEETHDRPSSGELGGACRLAAGKSARQAAWLTWPIRLIVPYGPGSSADQVARLYGERPNAALGRQMIVEDKPGASGGVAAQMVANSAPDGYTLRRPNLHPRVPRTRSSSPRC
jgi:tripartite-type tricarboxylate transporter receptor subunit TctC